MGWQGALIILAVGFIYAGVVRGTWLWDDNSEITSNLDLRGPWWKLWVAPSGPDYFPLKSMVQWFEWRLWHADSTLGYHLVSVALHATSALLVWRLLTRLGLRFAWLGGCLFAIHPLAVESVAWMAELKNTLSLPPLLLAALAWLDFDESGHRPRDYGRALIWFVVALLGKSSVVTFPVMLLLHAAWKRSTLRRSDGIRVAPFFLVGLLFGLITVWFQSHQTGWQIDMGGPAWRLALASSTTGFYLRQLFWPMRFLPIYPGWIVTVTDVKLWLPWLLWGAFALVAWRKREGWGRHFLFGSGCLLASLAPILGLVPMAYFHLSWVADHLAYLALVPAVAIIAGAVEGLAKQLPSYAQSTLLIAIGALCFLLVFQSRAYAGYFRDPEKLWSYTIEQDPNSWLARNNLGVVRLEQERWPDAIALLAETVRLKPDYAAAHSNWGDALSHLRRWPEAVEHYETALRLDPGAVEAHYNLANALVGLRRPQEAVGHYVAALKLAPASVDAHYNLGNVLLQLGQWSKAVIHFRAALALHPDLAEGHLGLGEALVATGHLPEAAPEFQAAIARQPSSAEAHYSLADVWVQVGRAPEALPHYQAARDLAPDRMEIRFSFGEALLATGHKNEAIAEFSAVLRANPTDTDARAALQRARSLP